MVARERRDSTNSKTKRDYNSTHQSMPKELIGYMQEIEARVLQLPEDVRGRLGERAAECRFALSSVAQLGGDAEQVSENIRALHKEITDVQKQPGQMRQVA